VAFYSRNATVTLKITIKWAATSEWRTCAIWPHWRRPCSDLTSKLLAGKFCRSFNNINCLNATYHSYICCSSLSSLQFIYIYVACFKQAFFLNFHSSLLSFKDIANDLRALTRLSYPNNWAYELSTRILFMPSSAKRIVDCFPVQLSLKAANNTYIE